MEVTSENSAGFAICYWNNFVLKCINVSEKTSQKKHVILDKRACILIVEEINHHQSSKQQKTIVDYFSNYHMGQKTSLGGS